MAQIPPDQKFHTLNADTPTQERGSAQADGLREIYTMQDIIDSVTTGGGINFLELGDTPSSYEGAAGQAAIVNDDEDGIIFGPAGGNVIFKAKLQGSITATSRLRYFYGDIDATTGLPLVSGSNPGPSVTGEFAVGLGISGTSGDVIDVAVHGTFDNVKFAVPVGDIPDADNILYIGAGSSIFEGQLTINGADDHFSAGRIISTPTFVSSFPGFYDVYEATVFVHMPWLNSYYRDDILYYDSTRITRKGETGTVENGEIVKLNSSDLVERWDVSAGDTVNEILGVTTTNVPSTGNNSTVCLRGLLKITAADIIGGAAVAEGDILYSDATNSYELTTDPTSGIQIGIVVSRLGDTIEIDVNPIKGGGGGATTGEKLDFTVRSDAYAATGDHEGIDLKIGGAASVTVGLSYYWDGDWNVSDAVLPASGDGLMAMATDTGVGVNMMQKGIIQLAANPTGAVAGSVLYFETSGTGTAGTLTATAPSASGNIVRVAGHAIDAAGLVYFDPSEDWLEII